MPNADYCKDCKEHLPYRVCYSAAGYYIGTECNCGPFDRHSGYFGSREVAQQVLDSGEF